MYRSILVPLDGSKRAEAILPHVETFAQKYEAKVIFATVIEPESVVVAAEPFYATWDNDTLQRQTDQAKTYLSGLKGEFREKGIEVDIKICYGPIENSLIEVAENSDVDLVAMATHGRTGMSRMFYGSVAAGMLHRMARPLFLVRSLEET